MTSIPLGDARAFERRATTVKPVSRNSRVHQPRRKYTISVSGFGACSPCVVGRLQHFTRCVTLVHSRQVADGST